MTGRTRLTAATAILTLTLVACGGISGDDESDATGDTTTTTLLLSGVGGADDGGNTDGTAGTSGDAGESDSDTTNSNMAITTTDPPELPDGDTSGLSDDCRALLAFMELDQQIINEEWERIAAKPAYEIAIRDLPDDLKPAAITYSDVHLEVLDLFALYGGLDGTLTHPDGAVAHGRLTVTNETYLNASRTVMDAVFAACET
jgi:hypothetical protein